MPDISIYTAIRYMLARSWGRRRAFQPYTKAQVLYRRVYSRFLMLVPMAEDGLSPS